jgi:DNA-binding transcriptional MerR regulator
MPNSTAQDQATARLAAAGEAESEATFSIGEIAGEFGVSQRTLRFYEDRGFIAPGRNGAVRFYRQADRDRIAIILRAKRLGFTLREIGDMLESANRDLRSLNLSRSQCTAQINFLERQKRAIEAALVELRRAYSEHYLSALAAEDRKTG